jgi:hypothetical protein
MQKQHQIYVWNNDPEVPQKFDALCGMCKCIFTAYPSILELSGGQCCPGCGTVYHKIDIDRTGSCNHGVIGNGKDYTDERLACLSSKQTTEAKP